MGNTKSQKLKENYIKGKYNVKESRKDQLLGLYSVLQFHGYDSDIYIQKVLNPAEYDEYADINEFIKKLSNSCKNICEFFFVEYNTQNQDLFDLVFEFGAPLSLPLKKEKYIWRLIEQLTDGLLFLEDNVLHYPFLHKNYIVQSGDKNFKLVNPYCFPDYLKEVLQIYMNPMNPVSNRKIYSKTQIKRNLREFAVLIITLIQSHSVQRLLKEPNYWQEALIGMRGKISPDLESFIAFILQQKANAPQSFHDVKNWLNMYGPSFNGSTLNIFTNKTITPKKPVNLAPGSNRKVDVFGTPNQTESRLKPIKVQEKSPEKGRDANLQQLNQFYQDDLKQVIKKSSSTQDLGAKPPSQKSRSQQPVKQHLLDSSHQEEVNKNPRNSDHRRESISKPPLIDTMNNSSDFEFVNHVPSPNKSINSYFINQRDVRDTVLSDYYFDELNTKEDADAVNFTEPPLPEVNIDLAKTKNESLPDLPVHPQDDLEHKNSLPLEQEKPAPVPETPAPKPVPGPDTSKKIQKVLIRWMREENRYQKTIEYTDGTSEIVPMDNEEDNQYKQFTSKYAEKPQAPVPKVPDPDEKRSHMAVYDYKNINPMTKSTSFVSQTDNLMIMMLYMDDSEPPLLLFKTQGKPDPMFFSKVASVVDQSKPVKPSVYHQIEEDPVIEVSRLKTSQLRHLENSDKKPTVVRSVNEISALNDTSVSMPTSFGAQKRVLIQKK